MVEGLINQPLEYGTGSCYSCQVYSHEVIQTNVSVSVYLCSFSLLFISILEYGFTLKFVMFAYVIVDVSVQSFSA